MWGKLESQVNNLVFWGLCWLCWFCLFTFEYAPKLWFCWVFIFASEMGAGADNRKQTLGGPREPRSNCAKQV